MKNVDNKPNSGEEVAENTLPTQQNKKCCGVSLKEKVCLRLQTMRYCRGLTRKEVAFHLGLSPITYSNYETGKSEMNYSVLVKVARFFDCTLDWLLFVDDEF